MQAGVETEALLTLTDESPGAGLAQCSGRGDEFWPRLDCHPMGGGAVSWVLQFSMVCQQNVTYLKSRWDLAQIFSTTL